MAKLYKFKEEQETPEFCCPQCELVENYTELLLDAESEEELKQFLSWAIEDAVKLGVKRALTADIENKMSILDDMDKCNCEDCNEDCDR